MSYTHCPNCGEAWKTHGTACVGGGIVSLAQAPGYGAGDWPQDFPDENGNYRNQCGTCGEMFTGHKRRMCCRVCWAKWKQKWDSMSGVEREQYLKDAAMQINEWLQTQHHNSDYTTSG